MHSVRRAIKDDFISNIGINPREYDRLRGVQPLCKREEYRWDAFDMIVTRVANSKLKVTRRQKSGRRTLEKGRILDAFWCLYSCYSEKEVSEYLAGESDEGNAQPLDLATVKRYRRKALREVNKALRENEEIKKAVESAIKEQYGRSQTSIPSQ